MFTNYNTVTAFPLKLVETIQALVSKWEISEQVLKCKTALLLSMKCIAALMKSEQKQKLVNQNEQLHTSTE